MYLLNYYNSEFSKLDVLLFIIKKSAIYRLSPVAKTNRAPVISVKTFCLVHAKSSSLKIVYYLKQVKAHKKMMNFFSMKKAITKSVHNGKDSDSKSFVILLESNELFRHTKTCFIVQEVLGKSVSTKSLILKRGLLKKI